MYDGPTNNIADDQGLTAPKIFGSLKNIKKIFPLTSAQDQLKDCEPSHILESHIQ